MSTRCCINFTCGDNDEPEAKIYRHCDGYPDGVLPDLDKFFDDVKGQCEGDTRFGDPSYLAAKFVVWQSQQRTRFSTDKQLLNFLSVGVVIENPGDIEYEYFVHCADSDAKPTVTHREL